MQPTLFRYVRVALDHPLSALYDYRWTLPSQPLPGMLVQVPFGRRQIVGLVIEVADATDVPEDRLRDVQSACIDCPPLDANWLQLIAFAADYYQRGRGEVALPALPQALRDAARWPRLFAREPVYRLTTAGRDRLPDALPARATALRRLAQALLRADTLGADDARAIHPKAVATLEQWQEHGWVHVQWRGAVEALEMSDTTQPPGRPGHDVSSRLDPCAVPELNAEQRAAVEAIDAARGFAPFVLHGVTGSGKTEVYLHSLAALFARRPDAQALVMVPEINLTPQFEAVFRARFSHWPATALVTLHSGLADGERARNWLAAHAAGARIVLGTRMAVLASLPRLALIIVDEEHEPAYKQQEGLRYSARDLAVWRAKQLSVSVVLGSATPSLETWWHACQRRYTTLALSRRAVADATLPRVRLIDMEAEKQTGRHRADGLSMPLVKALQERLARGEQSLVFLNRRGYAPVLACDACGWVAGCSRCSAYVVLHRPEQRMRCHHCGGESRIPRACPACGNVDLAPFGRGTQRIEEALGAAVPGARVLRIDADSTRRKGSAQALLSGVHAGDVDILVGTQMIAKGHDFQRVTLVGVLNADAALFSHDFRAGERLFAQLMQVSGRAGRGGTHGEVLIQTGHARHALYAALARHDYVGFAETTLAERRDAHLPPFVFQALLRAEARGLDDALRFLNEAAAILDAVPGAECVTRYDPVPLNIVKVMHVHRAQLLLESASRAALQRTLHAWVPRLRELKGALRWNVEVDPLDI
ncbi:primosomal protein N' [Mycetohabitans rhizoxinica]|nr:MULTISPECIES: primosomal protein N' [Mycetohabitans]MCG1046013.1 primosomal protein N' [Mycetohabitans sp. B6]